MDYKELITALITLLGLCITGYLSWRLGKLQVQQLASSSTISNNSTREIEFREDLLLLIGQQEEKLKNQDVKIDKLETQVDTLKALADEFRRANLNLAIENQQMKRRIAELEKGTL